MESFGEGSKGNRSISLLLNALDSFSAGPEPLGAAVFNGV